MGYIYCITNLINGKKYVGKTTQTIEQRFKEHCRDSRKEVYKKRPLYDAMRKYGVENFKVEQLEEVLVDDNLSDREVFWIKELQSYGHNGYNATEGGDGKVLYDYKEIIEIYNLGYNIKQTAKKVGCCQDIVSKVLKAHGIAIRNGNGKKIEQYDLAGNHIQTFNNSKKAAEWLIENGLTKSMKSRDNVSKCCLGKAKTAFGYIWKYSDL